MAVYKIFASKDTSLYSNKPALNAGLDEILDIGVKNNVDPLSNLIDPVPSEPLLSDNLRRALIMFDDSDLETIKQFRTGSWQTNLRLFLANAENLNTDYTLEVRQILQSWEMGTGKLYDTPQTRNGACWYTSQSYYQNTSNWANGSYYLTPGGGSWTTLFVTQSFSYRDSKDINSDVTTIVTDWFDGNASNYGFLIKHTDAIEQNSGSYIVTQFFSVDTHTIYPPTLEIKWDDSVYDLGSLSVIQNNNNVISLGNNLDYFKTGTTKYKFLINARDKYPIRTFTTSSLYTTNKALPITSYWAIQDAKTEDMIIDFDTNYTKISCDGTSSYFNLYMNGLEPERYYKVLIRTTFDTGESYDIDNNLIFKVIR